MDGSDVLDLMEDPECGSERSSLLWDAMLISAVELE